MTLTYLKLNERQIFPNYNRDHQKLQTGNGHNRQLDLNGGNANHWARIPLWTVCCQGSEQTMFKQDTEERTDPHYLDKVKAFCCNLKSSMREKDAMRQSSHGAFLGVGEGNEGRGSKVIHKPLRTGVS